MSHLLAWGEPLQPNEDFWGWAEFGYLPYFAVIQRFAAGSPNNSRVDFYSLNASALTISGLTNFTISDQPSVGGVQGGWNADKSSYVIIRELIVPVPDEMYLAAIDTSDGDATNWTMSDITDLTGTVYSAAPIFLRYVPPSGTHVSWISSSGGGASRELHVLEVATLTFTTYSYTTFFPTFTGDIHKYAYSPDGRWLALMMQGTSTDGIWVFDRSLPLTIANTVYFNATVFSAAADTLFHFTDDSSLFTFGTTTVYRVPTSTWVETSFAIAAEWPRWVSPDGNFYFGSHNSRRRFWDSTLTLLVDDVESAVSATGDWNQEGTVHVRATGSTLGTSKALTTTPGFSDTNVGGSRDSLPKMRPWL